MAIPLDQDLEKDVLYRLEKGFSDQQTAIQSTRDEVNTLKSNQNVMQRDMATLVGSIDKLAARFDETRKTNWPLLALLSGLLPLIIGGMGFFITSYTASAISPFQTQIAQVQTNVNTLSKQISDIASIQISRGKEISLIAQETTTNGEIIKRMTTNQERMSDQVVASAAADVASRTDRLQLNDRMKKLEDIVAHETADRRAQGAEFRVHLGEIEEQFHSVSNLENLRAAQQERLNALMWEKSHPGDRYPNGTFFPTSIFQGAGGAPVIADPPDTGSTGK
jgi:hypothetical protein